MKTALDVRWTASLTRTKLNVVVNMVTTHDLTILIREIATVSDKNICKSVFLILDLTTDKKKI